MLANIVALIAIATVATGAVQAIAPGLVLGLIATDVSPIGGYFFRIVGMFMVLFGGLCLHSYRRTAAFVPLLWCSLQKFAASVAVLLGVFGSFFSGLALGVAVFDLFSGIVILIYARKAAAR